jgi:hypothetical protein
MIDVYINGRPVEQEDDDPNPVCPWCESHIAPYHFQVERDGVPWHDRCAWAKDAGLEKGWTAG